MSNTTILTDLGRCEPNSAIAERNTRGCWRAVPYDLGDVQGTMLIAGPETEAAPVTLPLDAEGWHAVHLGLWPQYGIGEKPLQILAKLSNDPSFVIVNSELQDQYNVDEVFWKCADLTGQSIVFGQSLGGFRAGIAFVKLVPLSDEETRALAADRRRTDTRRLIVTVDNHGLYYGYNHSGEEDIHRLIEGLRDSDVGRILWNNGGSADAGCFPTKVGRVANLNCNDFPRVGDRIIAENMRMYIEKGIDTMAVARDYTRELGMEFHCALRMGAFQFQPPHDEVFTSPVYLEHPEWRCRDHDGSEVSRLSYAFPEVQEYVLALLEELASYEPDGLNLTFVRGGPFMLYEEPIIEEFHRRTGRDARSLPENDPDYRACRCDMMTDFIRKVRQLCDRNGRRMALSAFVYNNEKSNTSFALDVGAWVREKLVDFLLPYPKTDTGEVEPMDLDYFASLASGTGCELYPEISRGVRFHDDDSPAAYRRQALAAYAKGAHGLSLWDASSMGAPRKWSMIRRLGHKDEISGFDDGEGTYYRTLPLKSVGEYRLDKYTPHWAY